MSSKASRRSVSRTFFEGSCPATILQKIQSLIWRRYHLQCAAKKARTMKTIWRILGYLVLAVVVLLAAGAAFLATKKPAMKPASAEKIEATPARLARGRYVVENVADCLHCHSDFYHDRFGIPTKPGTEGQGGYPFDKKLGVPGLVQAQNITSDPEHG